MCTNPSSLHQLLTLDPSTNHWPLHWTLVVMLSASNPCTDPLQWCAMHQTLTRNPCSDAACIKSLQGTLPVAHYTAQDCMEHKARGWCKCQGVGARVDVGVTGWTRLVQGSRVGAQGVAARVEGWCKGHCKGQYPSGKCISHVSGWSIWALMLYSYSNKCGVLILASIWIFPRVESMDCGKIMSTHTHEYIPVLFPTYGIPSCQELMIT
jgi:hypothetical protein